jgi:hypothetical protein
MFFLGLRFQSFITLNNFIQAMKSAIPRILRDVGDVAVVALTPRKAIFRLIILSILSIHFQGRGATIQQRRLGHNPSNALGPGPNGWCTDIFIFEVYRWFRQLHYARLRQLVGISTMI